MNTRVPPNNYKKYEREIGIQIKIGLICLRRMIITPIPK